MGTFEAVILGIIQGLTEFLPVSSSGHLVLAQSLLGLNEPELFFDISVHMGTLAAILIVFYKDIQAIIVSMFRLFFLFFRKGLSFSSEFKDPDTSGPGIGDSNIKLALLILIGSIPTAFLGLMFHQVADRLFSSVIIVGCMLIVTGFFLWATRWIKIHGTVSPDLSIKKEGFSMNKALVIGLVQGMAVIPGISRSGSTIVAGLFLGLNRETAARYSFLLSIPAIMGAEILSLKDSFSNPAIMDNVTLIGTFSSFVVGYAALRILLYLVKEGRLHFFAPYCWIIGIMAIISGL